MSRNYILILSWRNKFPGKDLIRRLCKSKIIDVLDGNGWYYICRPECAHTVCQLDEKYHCSNCTEEAGPYTERYRVIIRIEDASGTTNLTLFNKEA